MRLNVDRRNHRREYSCSTCDTEAVRDEKYDAFYCPACMVWLESQCPDLDCGFCLERPDRPGTP